MQNSAGPTFLADCPSRLAVEILSDKWASLVIYALSQKPRRHGELIDAIGGVSRKVLTETLHRLQRDGLVERLESMSHRIEYRLTDLGHTLTEPIEALNSWASTYGEAVTEFRDAT